MQEENEERAGEDWGGVKKRGRRGGFKTRHFCVNISNLFDLGSFLSFASRASTWLARCLYVFGRLACVDDRGLRS